MRVDLLNTYLDGGAGIAATRLHEALTAAGIDSRLWYSRRPRQQVTTPRAQQVDWRGSRDSGAVRSLGRLKSRLLGLHQKWQLRRARKQIADREIFTAPKLPNPTSASLGGIDGDVLHLHWVAKMIDYPSFFASLPDGHPIVWTLHDMNPLTGGCHHADECRQFTSSCCHCPQLSRSGLSDLSQQFFQLKRAAYQDRNLHVVTPSRWLEAHVRHSQLLGGAQSVQTIYNGIDTQVFAPGDRKASQQRFGLSGRRIVIGFAAASLQNRRKGFIETLESLALLSNCERYEGLAMGGGELPETRGGLPKIHQTGYLDKPSEAAEFYAALDVFVITSWAENMPQTVVEALSCGVPVVAFDVGGISEIVLPHRTGLLAPLHDCGLIARHIDWLAERPEARELFGKAGREVALREFEVGQQARRYIELYESLTADRATRLAA